MRSFYQFLDFLSRKLGLTILIPCISSIGNCAEQIQFALIKARRESRRLILIYPFDLPWKFRFPIINREILNLTSPLILEPGTAIKLASRLVITLIYGPLRVASLVAGKITGHYLPSFWVQPTIGSATLWQPRPEMDDLHWDIVESYNWPEELGRPVSSGLKAHRLSRARDIRQALGLPSDAWFACLHVRESGFYNDDTTSGCRNADIVNYLPGIESVTKRGGWVLRMGDKSMKPLPPMERVIDYPHTVFKSELMDIYLLSECKLFIGMSSGLMDAAFLFHKPMVLTNMTNWTFVYPRRPGDRGIMKHVYSRPQGRFLSVQEVLEAPWSAQHFAPLGNDYEMRDNTPEEIRDVVVEFLNADGQGAQSDLQKECNRRRVIQAKKLISGALWADHFHDMHNRYRLASRVESSMGSLGQQFLESNWNEDSFNKKHAADAKHRSDE